MSARWSSKAPIYPPSLLVSQSLQPGILMARRGVETPKKTIPIDLSLFQKSLAFPHFMTNKTSCCLLNMEQLFHFNYLPVVSLIINP